MSKMTRNESLYSKGMEAAKRFLYKRGYEIVGECASELIDLVAKDEDTLVFAIVRVNVDGFMNHTPNWDQVESEAARYLKEKTDDVNFAIRFDIVDINVLGGDRAMIRHHISAFTGEKNRMLTLLKELLAMGEISEKAYNALVGEC